MITSNYNSALARLRISKKHPTSALSSKAGENLNLSFIVNCPLLRSLSLYSRPRPRKPNFALPGNPEEDSHRSRRSANLRMTASDLRETLCGLSLSTVLLDFHRHHHPHSLSHAPFKFISPILSVLFASRRSDFLVFCVNKLETLLFGCEHGITKYSDGRVSAPNYRH
jgi:hypothetical protein